MLSFEKAMESSKMGFARHKVIYDEEGKPVDYIYLSVNASFEQLTGLKKKDIVNQRFIKVFPKRIDDDFDWIGCFGKIATDGGKRVLERYISPLDKWYRIEAFSCEKGYFTTVFSDITHERELAVASKKFLDDQEGSNSYEQITQRMKRITGAHYVALNLFLEEGGKFLTAAIAGVSSSLQKAAEMLGFNPLKKEWPPDPRRFQLIREKIVTPFEHLHDLTGNVISKTGVQLLEKTFNLGKAVIIKITQGERFIGDFTLMFSKDQELENENEAIIYADMVGMLIEKRNRQRELDENEKQLQESKQQLELAMDAGEHGFWDWNLETDDVYFSPGYFKMLGYGPDEFPMKKATWVGLLHPEDRKRSVPKMETYVRHGKPFTEEFRMKCKDGSYKWISARGKSYYYDKSGKPHRAVGVHVDIDQLKRKTEALKESHRMAKMGRWDYDHKKNSLEWNEGIFDIFELNVDTFEVTYQTFIERVHPDDRERVDQTWKKSLDTHQPYEIEHRILLDDGRVKWIREHCFTEYDEQNKPQHSAGIAQDITELTQERRKAEEANKAKSIFLANMNHELRTPLNGIIGFSDILKDTSLNDDQKDFVDIIFSSGKHLLGIITDILDFSRIEAGKFELHPEKTELRSLIDKTLSIVRHKVETKGLTLSADIGHNVPQTVKVDGPRLKQVLLNLLSNAVKFTDEGSVQLSVNLQEMQTDKARLLFKITDTGIGLKEKDQEKIFEPFHQADMSSSKRAEGTGLGLAITKEMLEKMGSALKLNSTYGKGSEFYFELLLPYEEEEQIESDKADSENTTEHLSYKNKKILIAEDNLVNMKYVQTALSMFSKDLQIIKANNGQEAYELYLRHKPDLILMDIVMPAVDGYRATDMIRQSDETVPIIAMTAKALKTDREDCLNAGMDDYIAKPVSLERLKDTLKKYL